ncbi:hypothetical protein C4K22_3647 [Pseudomonas chlororaphis subsp. aurantiaca]|uniref:tetratricopeptide repeat protein n=1 Tax=Pseudomonas chlororaphis TaxID=587753 RepID=UPI000F58E666|nr:tetratricopeptide repeat protein [Pseudomonas chlororaphis]AZD36388.1 hypothetical protein C4K22_3647 [Pseudomonas chlororaphis subsp. aurantiaca]AZD42727.1 hypothetical protein C4K21_3655 [Pseudomonas chlororaphis subsp. aurantiaca]AZD73892.1 hypothetical protein C4K16_3534 [Pseudomonas chlororaphis subsp. aurantiaca]
MSFKCMAPVPEPDMKCGKRNRYAALLAAVLLSLCPPAWAAEPKQELSYILLLKAQRLDREESLAAATVAARVAMEAGRREGVNGIKARLDGGTLLVNLLFKQGKYAEARAAAEEQVAYEDAAEALSNGRRFRNYHSAKLLGVAIEASMRAGERAEVTRLQEKLFAVGRPYSGLWRLAPDEPRLRYELAGLSLPLMVEQWKLTEFEPADKRDFSARVRYSQALVNGPLSAEISLYYDETQRGRDATQRQESLKRYQGTPAEQVRASAMPDLPFDGLTSVKGRAQWEDSGEQGVRGIWVALRGDWRLHVAVDFSVQDEAQAMEQLGKFFATLQWQGEHPLFRERTMAEQERAIDLLWATPGGWSKAGELAEQALPDAFFALEIARLNTFVGVSQYRRGALEDARRSLEKALPAWQYNGGDPDGGIYQTALDYAADIAYRQGRNREAIALNRTFLDWQESDALWGWGIPEGGNALINRATGMQLPMRVGTYRLSYGSANRFYYENVQTGVQLGLSAGLDASSDDELESMLRAFMAGQLQLQAGNVRKTTFVPKSVKREATPVFGRKWVFDITKGVRDEGVADVDPITGAQRATPIAMAFWIVDRKGQRSLLRAPVMSGGQTETEANQVAQALSW